MEEKGPFRGIMIALIVIGILLVGNIVLTVVFRAERNLEIERLREQVSYLFSELNLEPPGQGANAQRTAEMISRWRVIQKKRLCAENLRSLGKAIEAYAVADDGWLPSSADLSTDFPETQPASAPVKKNADDPQP